MFDHQALVVQANKLIMSPQKFSYEEKRFLICLISKINPADEDFKWYKIQVEEYASFIDRDVEYVRKTLPKITGSIMTQYLEIEDDDMIRQRNIIISSDHYKKYGYLEVKIHPDMKEVLLDLKQRFTQYKLENALNMRSKHAIRLYEIVKANEFKEQKRFRLSWSNIPKALKKDYLESDIQKLLDTNYKQFYEFERWVLIPTQEEMKKHTDVYFDYKKVKVSRYVVAIDFYIQENVPTENHNKIGILDILPSADKFEDKTPMEMAKMAEKAIDNIDRGQLCREFQKAVKREYGFDFPIGLLEGISNQRIVEVLPIVGSLGIMHRDKASSVIDYIAKTLRGKRKG